MSSTDRRPLIGLTVGCDPRDEGYLRVRRTYARAIELAGGVPVLVAPMTQAGSLLRLLESLDGLLFPGGLDVGPELYGAPRHETTKVDPVLDELEMNAARWAATRELPVLGICRGQQLLNVALGGTLIQDIPTERPDSLVHAHAGRPRHELTHAIELREGSRLAEIFGTRRFEVNSFHHQAVDRLAAGLEPMGWAPDGVVEAIESTRHPWLLSVQFHPEDLVDDHAPSQRLFRAFVEAAARSVEPRVGRPAASAASSARRV